jgi:isoleucyl-tRNA synthetase
MSSYKETLQLPRTDFPMKAGLPQREPEMLARWEKEGLYEKIQAARADAPEYILHDGPPFANGDVHMGTALNKVLKDLVIKSKTMAGYRAPFIPGWDCHGLPIEFKVVKESAGLNPVEIRQRCEQYARNFIDIQRGQFKRLGVLGDWAHPYLTLDPGYEAQVIRAFGQFVAQGLVYRKRKPVRWSYGAQTALAEAEVESKEKTSTSVFVKFPIEEGRWAGSSLAIWTTTPWTLPANLAVAAHASFTYAQVELPGFGRIILAQELLPSLVAKLNLESSPVVLETFPGQDLVGTVAQHPFLERTARVYAADFVTLETGTGLVHIAPGHGEEDYHLGVTHGLDLLSPVDDEGKFTQECGVPALVGQHVFAANPKVVEILRERDALLLTEDYLHTYPHCWRSKTPVIFRAVEQFFINVEALRTQALAAVDGVEWIPTRSRTRIRGTVESRPDWCISRQRTWGVPLPVFYEENGTPILDPALIEKVAGIVETEGTNAWFAWTDAQWNEKLGLPPSTTRRSDTLDVWIDSGVSHRAVLDRHPALSAPADLYLEATDQHRGWFQSSLMTSVALRDGAAPYRAVLTHGFVVDVDTKRKISKSEAGGYQKPTDADHYMKKYGADLLRLWVCSVNFTDDVPFSEEIFTRLSDAYRRLRNTLRILLGNLHDFDPARDAVPFEQMPEVDRWILGELHQRIEECRAAYSRLEFHKVYQLLTQFCAVELSSQYVDITKDRLYCDALNSPRRRSTQTAMAEIFSSLCRLLAPILCFTAEEAWGYFSPGSSVHLEEFPAPEQNRAKDHAVATVRQWLEIRAKVAQAMEAATKAGTITNPLEACVTIHLPAAELESLQNLTGELEEFLILSHLELSPAEAWQVEVSVTPRGKCERCWRHRADLGTDPHHPTLCGRCTEAVNQAADV